VVITQPFAWFTGAAQIQPTNLFTSKSFPSRSMKKHAFDSLLANALSAITRLPLRVFFRWNQARISGEYRTE
jgi:hypothetical protein